MKTILSILLLWIPCIGLFVLLGIGAVVLGYGGFAEHFGTGDKPADVPAKVIEEGEKEDPGSEEKKPE